MSDDAVYYRTEVAAIVISKRPVDGLGLIRIGQEADYGYLVMYGESYDTSELTAEQVAEALRDAGSDPADFFEDDNDGNLAESVRQS
jgi:hypothetical protein